MKQNLNKTVVITFVLIGCLLVFNVLSYTGMVTKEDWACSQYVCDKQITAQDWINENCYTLPDGSNKVMCKVIIEDKEQLISLEMIDQQALNQCVEVRCVQEARVRPADYNVDLQQPQE
ncbi:MAG: hypothetical protein L6408_02510 [Nanoarchaeota archaeon]|nr:hypothetical protein [Nanoarchaeota archaeon]